MPVFRFVISDKDHRRELHSFAIDSEIATDALHHAHPAFRQGRIPAPAFEIEAAASGKTFDGEVIRRGAERFLTISMVTLEDPPRVVGKPPGAGIRFAPSDGAHQPLYSFTMNWPRAFVVLSVAWEGSG